MAHHDSPASTSTEGVGPPVYGRCPRVILRDPSISAQAKALFALLDDFASPDSPEPWPSQETLAEHLDVSTRTVGTWLAELKEAGYVECQKTRSTNVHRLLWPTDTRKHTSALARKHTSALARKQTSEKEEPLKENQGRSARESSSSSTRARTEPQRRPTGSEEEEEEESRAGKEWTQGSLALDPLAEEEVAQPLPADDAFEVWWSAYPSGKRGSKVKARASWRKALETVTVDALFARRDHYIEALAAYQQRWYGCRPPVLHAATFLNGRHEDFDHSLADDEVADLWPQPKLSKRAHDMDRRLHSGKKMEEGLIEIYRDILEEELAGEQRR